MVLMVDSVSRTLDPDILTDFGTGTDLGMVVELDLVADFDFAADHTTAHGDF